VKCRWRDDAYEVDVVTLDQFPPVGCDVFDVKLFSDGVGVVFISTGDSDYARTHAVTEAGNLRCAGKSSADYSNANCFSGG
jgi:hypothetical protein